MQSVDFTLLDVVDTTSEKGWTEAVKVYPEASGHSEAIDAAIKAQAHELAALQAYEKAKSNTEDVWSQAARAIGCE